MTTSEILRRAGDVLRKQGHCKSRLQDDAGRLCLFGAVNVAEHDSPYHSHTPAMRHAHAVVGSLFGDISDAIAWNNAEERTGDDATLALDAAYVLALQEEGIEPEDVL